MKWIQLFGKYMDIWTMFVTILDPFGNLVKQFFDSRNMSHKGFC